MEFKSLPECSLAGKIKELAFCEFGSVRAEFQGVFFDVLIWIIISIFSELT